MKKFFSFLAVMLMAVTANAGYEYVDLGLPSGTLWATCNVGAGNPEGYGDYFAWGETETKTCYDYNTYKYCMGSHLTFTKYCTNSEYGYNGFTDGKLWLDPEDDAATVNMGDDWRTPSIGQLIELMEKCTRKWTQKNGVNGYLLTGPNGKQLFLPAAGYRRESDPQLYDGYYAIYRSDLISEDLNMVAYYMWFESNKWGWEWLGGRRSDGCPVRAVRVKKVVYTEFVEETGTLTYYYNGKRASRTGITELYDPIKGPDAIRFKDYNDKVVKAVIDPSMKDAELTSMKNMFYGNIDSETFDIYGLPNMTSIEGLENLNTSSVTDMNGMFYLCQSLTSLDLSSFNTSNVTDMRSMFMGCNALQIVDLTSFDVSKVTSMRFMFGSCRELITICCYGNWSTAPSLTDSYLMFSGCNKITGSQGSTLIDDGQLDATYARPDKGKYYPGYFMAETMTGIKAIDNGQWTIDNDGAIFNLAGQRLNKMQRGLNIVGGRKIVIK